MHLLLYVYKCFNCGGEFKLPHLRGIPYGEFLFRSEKGNLAYLNALEDPYFEGISTVFGASKYMSSRENDSVTSTVFHSIYGVICDPASDGSQYKIDPLPICPNCGADHHFSRTPTHPAEWIEMDVPNVSYHHWNTLSPDEKQNLIEKAIEEFLKENPDYDIK